MKPCGMFSVWCGVGLACFRFGVVLDWYVVCVCVFVCFCFLWYVSHFSKRYWCDLFAVFCGIASYVFVFLAVCCGLCSLFTVCYRCVFRDMFKTTDDRHNTHCNAHKQQCTHIITTTYNIHRAHNIQHTTYIRRDPTRPAVGCLDLGTRERCT